MEFAPVADILPRCRRACAAYFLVAPFEAQKTGNYMKDTRPVNLDLSTIRLPITAITSILTRISGVINFVSVAIMLWLLGLSLSGPEGFAAARDLLQTPLLKLVVWGILSVAIYHALSGIKHLFGDFGYGESLEGGVLGSRLIIVLSVILIALTGVWIW